MTADAFSRQFGLAGYIVTRNVEGITDEAALTAPSEGGNSMNWVLGHIVQTRNSLLEMLGLAPAMDPDRLEAYDRGAPPLSDPAAAVPLSELLAAYREGQVRLLAALRETTEADLAKPLPEPHELLGDTMGSAVGAFLVHETCHAGQLGVLRYPAGARGAIA